MLAAHQLTLVLRHLTPARAIDGCVAVLLPFDEDGRPDLEALAALVNEAYAAGLTPAVNTPAGYVDLLTEDERADVLAIAAGVARGRRFIAGAWIDAPIRPSPGGSQDLGARYARAMEQAAHQGATPLLIPCAALTALDEDGVVEAHKAATASHSGALAAEIGPVFTPHGRIYSLDLFQRLMDIPTLAGLHHASHSRVPEWYRLEARDARRPEFRLYTGNDLAIDMPSYGSDYLLAGAGLSPDGFSARDRLWASGDARVTEVNDALQYLCGLVCRGSSGGWRHGLARAQQLRGAIRSASTHPRSPRRPTDDRALIADALARVRELVQATTVERAFPLSAPHR